MKIRVGGVYEDENNGVVLIKQSRQWGHSRLFCSDKGQWFLPNGMACNDQGVSISSPRITREVNTSDSRHPVHQLGWARDLFESLAEHEESHVRHGASHNETKPRIEIPWHIESPPSVNQVSDDEPCLITRVEGSKRYTKIASGRVTRNSWGIICDAWQFSPRAYCPPRPAKNRVPEAAQQILDELLFVKKLLNKKGVKSGSITTEMLDAWANLLREASDEIEKPKQGV